MAADEEASIIATVTMNNLITPEVVSEVLSAYRAIHEAPPVGTVMINETSGDIAHRVIPIHDNPSSNLIPVWRVSTQDGETWIEQSIMLVGPWKTIHSVGP